MDVFDFRDQLVNDYRDYTKSFVDIRDQRIRKHIDDALDAGQLWPDPMVQLNPAFESGGTITELVASGSLHPSCEQIFRIGKEKGPGSPLRLHRHQRDAIQAAGESANYVLTTGTGSGKSLSYIIPIVDHVLRHGTGKGIKAIVIYPMNALANSQLEELKKFLDAGDGKPAVTFDRYTGQEDDTKRNQLKSSPPDILLTNFVMMEYILTRPDDQPILCAAEGLRFLVLDELHTYRGRQGADVAMLVRRIRDRLARGPLQCVGTSATMASQGTSEDRKLVVARAASRLFGAEVRAEHVIGESLRRVTQARDWETASARDDLKTEVLAAQPLDGFTAFLASPLASWIESTLGVIAERGTGRLQRQRPLAISGDGGAASELAGLTGLPRPTCERTLRDALLSGFKLTNPSTGFPAFAFRLHQFLSPGDQVFASLEAPSDRYITLEAQQFVPGGRQRILLPLVFCRECGSEYSVVRRAACTDEGSMWFEKRELNDLGDKHDDSAGFLAFDDGSKVSFDGAENLEDLPDDWTEEHQGRLRLIPSHRNLVPRRVHVLADGSVSDAGLPFWFSPAPFRFCLHCGVAYDSRQRTDFSKLYALGFEGRSTATTILSLSAVKALREDLTLAPESRKLLSFTDNRQDASLQAGHFNDFVVIGLTRAALLAALEAAGPEGLGHAELPQKVFEALQLPFENYAVDPEARFAARTETERALRDVLAYRIYQDLRRGWRVVAPNLEQCGLLVIDYASLTELAAAEDLWAPLHPVLASAKPAVREDVARRLLDWLRRALAIKVDCLDMTQQEQIRRRSAAKLLDLWGLDESEQMDTSTIALPGARGGHEARGSIHISTRSGFGRWLRRPGRFGNAVPALTTAACDLVIVDLLKALKKAGLVETVRDVRAGGDETAIQVPASALIWRAGDGRAAFHDPIRVPRPPATGLRTNPFFIRHYRGSARSTAGIMAREHTAQVPQDLRIRREMEFREGTLPLLYCSPTMELGVDIKSLNVVNLRNVPPTPANYAQRSGRAGRSGQPALVFTYCSRGSAHDRHFFRRQERMVAGVVEPPRIELANEDLVRSHLHAVWVAESGLSLGRTLGDILSVSGTAPTLDLLANVRQALDDTHARRRARACAERIMTTLRSELEDADWAREGWLDDDVFAKLTLRFEDSCARWRSLHRSATETRDKQHEIIRDQSRAPGDHRRATDLREEAETELKLLTQTNAAFQSDFYSYRYFASEGFLPGYNFPRLPLSAFIPGRSRANGRDEYLSRPRFLALTEFGPGAVIYHEGARYAVRKVHLTTTETGVPLVAVKICNSCGYLHIHDSTQGKDVCEHCQAKLPGSLHSMFRMQNVTARRRSRISSDEEERLRQGYEITTAMRFSEGAQGVRCESGLVGDAAAPLARLTYGPAAVLWRINHGWKRRTRPDVRGFMLDIENGFWAKESDGTQVDDAPDDEPTGPRVQRVIPFVEDRRNALVFEPMEGLTPSAMASLQAALKVAIQVRYQLEDSELAVEPLPSIQQRKAILLYEAAEGGAGVLRHLLRDPAAIGAVARVALEVCHFDPTTGADQKRSPRSREDCEAACYDCLMAYSNQLDHERLDRVTIRDFLMQIAEARIVTAPGSVPIEDHLKTLNRLAGSGLERQWLAFVHEHGCRVPDEAQHLFGAEGTRPDFIYRENFVAIYVDGPPHDFPERQTRDRERETKLRDAGWSVIRFHHKADWLKILQDNPSVFGKPR